MKFVNLEETDCRVDWFGSVTSGNYTVLYYMDRGREKIQRDDQFSQMDPQRSDRSNWLAFDSMFTILMHMAVWLTAYVLLAAPQGVELTCIEILK
jgi:hypothetical protein